MTRVLLVTGSRSLATIPGAEAWGRGLIHAAFSESCGTDLLLVGDAGGPDAWAWSIAATHVRHRWQFRVHGGDAGWIEQRENAPGSAADAVERVRWAPEGADTHPLNRNRVMVQTARWHMLRGHDVRCLALLDGTKRDAPGKRATRGTEHTAALAERAGILVERRTWSQEMGSRDAV